ncbi:hypothetical protein AXG93_3437s1040 [Marchantia polymorpha subsp. ruderalis]|uniref:Uncharacterized protein n=1 Tax=Marchantia polymorpha subsp. ruderalis TaxID=1480154 RepID=A0A176W1H1_MARPO|nr:hypothetical protein AXG93_3437s1040 [Marchantia polymorpha subsp. ruderalis]
MKGQWTRRSCKKSDILMRKRGRVVSGIVVAEDEERKIGVGNLVCLGADGQPLETMTVHLAELGLPGVGEAL